MVPLLRLFDRFIFILERGLRKTRWEQGLDLNQRFPPYEGGEDDQTPLLCIIVVAEVGVAPTEAGL